MKIIATALVGLSVAMVANAQTATIPGGITERTLKCTTNLEQKYVKFALVIKTQALAPEYFVRGGYLQVTELIGGPFTYNIEMSMLRQDINYAYFNVDANYNVVLNKALLRKFYIMVKHIMTVKRK